jgi:light-regulated signal transduction histidine kinase (bacteriophytochrome)
LSANRNLEKEIEERKISEDKVRLLNDQLMMNNQQLKATIEELDRFAYVASHDLQEPLRKILVFSDKIQSKYKESIDAEMDKSLDKIVRASERMQLLINDLLRFSRNTTGSEDFRQVDLNELVAEVLSDMETEIERLEAQVQIDNLPMVWGIPSQLRQLFQNLVGNAIKFRKKDEAPVVKVFYDVSAVMSRNDLGRIVVQDNGIGFDPKYVKEIFVVFKRLHSYHEFEGSGVGLSICKKIIERHNGIISAESQLGYGAKFIVDLPMIRKQAIEELPLRVAKNA